MDEHLQLQIGGGLDGGDFIERHLPFEHHPGDAEFAGDPQTGRVVEPHLSRGVEREFRKTLPRHPQQSEVLNEQSVGPELLKFCKV